MARARPATQIPTGEPSPFNIPHKDVLEEEQLSEASFDSESTDDEDREIPPFVKEDMTRFEEYFKGIGKQYRLIDRIGEGTFSTVYKAEDLLYHQHDNDWDLEATESSWVSPPIKKGQPDQRKPRRHYVAIKKIYVTSSPFRIQNELELLHDLRSCEAICPLITAFRHQDQVVAILPYYRHQDFREFFRDMRCLDMRPYFKSLFTALAAVHKHGILHRDIKPTNFLYDPPRERGVLVDFGLAEREGTDSSHCICRDAPARRRMKQEGSYIALNKDTAPTGFPKNDTRPSRRANRAGTRGFRAPEVLFKCTNQTSKIDIWSVGVILLTILSHRFPFFNSTDDVDAMIELSSVFGRRKMAACALLHGAVYDCTIPTVGEKGFTFEKLILWSTVRDTLSDAEKTAITLLDACLDLDPSKRISAREALEHPFLLDDTDLDDKEAIEVVEQ